MIRGDVLKTRDIIFCITANKKRAILLPPFSINLNLIRYNYAEKLITFLPDFLKREMMFDFISNADD